MGDLGQKTEIQNQTNKINTLKKNPWPFQKPELPNV